MYVSESEESSEVDQRYNVRVPTSGHGYFEIIMIYSISLANWSLHRLRSANIVER